VERCNAAAIGRVILKGLIAPYSNCGAVFSGIHRQIGSPAPKSATLIALAIALRGTYRTLRIRRTSMYDA